MAITNSRINLGSIDHTAAYPDFLDLQVGSFEKFFQLDTQAEFREKEGLFKVFDKTFPVTDARNVFELEFIDYFVDPPRYDIDECIERGLTYSVPLKARLKLSCNDEEHVDFETIEQDVFLGNIPYMSPRGTFIINGAERVVVSQLHRSPGVIFGQNVHPNGTKIYSARIIPFKGTWMEFSTDINSVLHAYLDRKKKVPVTTLLRAIGFGTDKDILDIFELAEEIKANKTSLKKAIGKTLAARVLKSWVEDFVDEDTGEVVSINRHEIILERGVVLNEDDQIRQYVIMELMSNFKLDIARFNELFKVDFKTYFKSSLESLESFANEGLITIKDNFIECSETGTLLIRNIAMAFDAYMQKHAASTKTFSKTV